MDPSAFLSGILCLALWLDAHNLATITSFAVFIGIFSGAVVSLSGPCVAQLSKPEATGTRIGILYAFLALL